LNQRGSLFVTYTSGILSGILFTFLFTVWIGINAPSWLVVTDQAHSAEIGVVLGGGGGSRLRAGLALYNGGRVDRLVLVGKSKKNWIHIQNNLCLDCSTEGKDVTILEGSVDTFTDASLLAEFYNSHDIDSVLVVTDPYHTRRALLIFESVFAESGIKISIESSGDYGSNLPPDENWWADNLTLSVIWGEIGKIIAFYLRR